MIKQRNILLGSTGLLGSEILKYFKSQNLDYIGVARKNSDYNLDITNDNELEDLIVKFEPNIVINCAGLINIDDCERNPDLAYLTNARPSSVLSELSKRYNFKYIYISTDNYYINSETKKHDTTEPVSLLNEYSRTKYAGEFFALTNPANLVIRTNIIGFSSSSNSNFINWLFTSFTNNSKISVFDDYFTSTITADQFSRLLYDLLQKNVSLNGVINLASHDVFSKSDLIIGVAKKLRFDLDKFETRSVRSLSVKRATNLGLDVDQVEGILGYKLPTLENVILEVCEGYKRRGFIK